MRGSDAGCYLGVCEPDGNGIFGDHTEFWPEHDNNNQLTGHIKVVRRTIAHAMRHTEATVCVCVCTAGMFTVGSWDMC